MQAAYSAAVAFRAPNIRLTSALCALAGAAALVAGCSDAPQGQIVRMDGSSTVFPITEGAAEDFQRERQARIKVTVGISGTGGGFKKFCRGEIDIANASRPIQQQEMDACRAEGVEYYELPVAFDALTVVVNPKNAFVEQLTVDELKRMWEPAAQGTIARWKQVNPAFPDAPLALFGAGADSGTFDYFTEAIVGRSKASRGDYTASEDDNVLVQGVSQDVHALAYFGYAYYAENRGRVRAVPIAAQAGQPAVAPSAQTVLDGTYQPLSRPIFIYVNAAALERPEVRQFVEYYMEHAPDLAAEVKYVPLPDHAYRLNLEHVAKGRKGTVFGGGSAVGITIDELMSREAAS